MNRLRLLLAGGLVVGAVAAFMLPRTFRVNLVVTQGVIGADRVTSIATTLGVICVLAVAALGATEVYRTMVARREATKARLAAEQWETLPVKDEARREILEPMLRQVASHYPDAARPIATSIDQLQTINESLEAIRNIFRRNAGIISMNPSRYADIELLISQMLERFTPGLVRIVYQAHADSAGAQELVATINSVNDANQVVVGKVRELAQGVAFSATQGESRDALLATVQAKVEELHSTTPREDPWL